MTPNAILLKLQPNQDIMIALEEAVDAAGLAEARIIAATGSLTQGMLARGAQVERVPGPAIEVAALSGHVKADGGTQLHAYLCCEDGSVIEGPLVRGQNGIAVTFEVLLGPVADAPAPCAPANAFLREPSPRPSIHQE